MNAPQLRAGQLPLLLFTIAITLALFLCQPQKIEAQWTTNGNNINNTNSGNVGVGTTAPQSPLHVYKQTNGGVTAVVADNDGSGTNTGQAFQFRYGTTGVLGGIYHQHDGTRWNLRFKLWTNTGTEAERLTIQGDTGNVGIGTTSPNYPVVVGPDFGSGFTYAKMTVNGGANQSASIVVGNGNLSTGVNAMEFGWDQTNGRGFVNTPGQPMAFMQNGVPKMVIDASGNLGVGTPTPLSSARLDVNGDVHVTGSITMTGNINAKYQDVAEWVPSAHAISAGTVVILDPSHSNQVMSSSTAYDTRVAGVVSEHPGVILGEAAANKVLVATTGRVKVRVDATHSPIHIGDLLATSDVEGVAMKSEPVNIGGVQIHRPGTLIGKALEPLERGTGEILVLLSLQ